MSEGIRKPTTKEEFLRVLKEAMTRDIETRDQRMHLLKPTVSGTAAILNIPRGTLFMWLKEFDVDFREVVDVTAIVTARPPKENHKEWDLFVCHASEDKNEFVRPLVTALINKGFHVWYDEFTLTIGDHLRRSIDKGLAQSTYGLVILSPNFFAKNWPQTELDGLAAREQNGKKVILPVWHKVNQEYVRKFSPMLADRIAASTEKGIDFIVGEVSKVMLPRAAVSQEKTEESISITLEQALNLLREKDEDAIKEIVRKSFFDDTRQTFLRVLDAIAISDSRELGLSESVFSFIELAILERSKREGTELFEYLLQWFFQTVTPQYRLQILRIFAKLTRLTFIKEVISRSRSVGSFVAEFASSNEYLLAGINAEILFNIQYLLSDADIVRIVDSALSNDQISFSWEARKYLVKMLAHFEGRIDRTKTEELFKKLTAP